MSNAESLGNGLEHIALILALKCIYLRIEKFCLNKVTINNTTLWTLLNTELVRVFSSGIKGHRCLTTEKCLKKVLPYSLQVFQKNHQVVLFSC